MTFAHLPEVVAVVADLGRRFNEAGARLYLVGGIVRDQWLDQPLVDSADIDLTTDALPQATKGIVAPIADALWTQGERFGTIGARIDGRLFEITTHRAESYAADSRKPAVSFGDEIDVDLSRRDFTVNAMAIEVPAGSLVDPWGGVDDLKAARLRTPLDPEVSFSDDPLRMLRAARFAAKYRLEPDPGLVAASTALRERLDIVAIERVGDELERLFSLDEPTVGLRFLLETGLLAQLFGRGGKALDAMVIDRFERGITAAARVGREYGWQTRLAALLFATFETADEVSAQARALRLANDDRRHIERSVRAARDALEQFDDDLHVGAVRRWRHESGSFASSGLAIAAAVDPDAAGVAELASMVASLEKAEGDGLRPIDGQAIMIELGVDGGPVVGEAIDMLQEALFAEGPLTDEQQIELLRAWWADR